MLSESLMLISQQQLNFRGKKVKKTKWKIFWRGRAVFIHRQFTLMWGQCVLMPVQYLQNIGYNWSKRPKRILKGSRRRLMCGLRSFNMQLRQVQKYWKEKSSKVVELKNVLMYVLSTSEFSDKPYIYTNKISIIKIMEALEKTWWEYIPDHTSE